MKRTPEQLAEILAMETEASEATRDQPSGLGGVRKNSTKSAVYSVRLTAEQMEQLQTLADELQVPASSLVRSWVAQRLAEERAGSGSVPALLEALSRDVDQLKRKLAA